MLDKIKLFINLQTKGQKTLERFLKCLKAELGGKAKKEKSAECDINSADVNQRFPLPGKPRKCEAFRDAEGAPAAPGKRRP